VWLLPWRAKTGLNESDASAFFSFFCADGQPCCARKPQEFIWPTIPELHERPTSLEEATLIGLAVHSRKSQLTLSTTQIARASNDVFAGLIIETNKNNVSRYFNFRPHPFYKVTKEGDVLKYGLSATGLSRALRLVSSRWSG
jgi:hypothetical protein